MQTDIRVGQWLLAAVNTYECPWSPNRALLTYTIHYITYTFMLIKVLLV